MTRYLIIGGMVAAIVGTVTIMGCGPRVQVAKDAMIKKLDKALGELNVKRAEIKQTQDRLRDKLSTLTTNRALAQSRLKLMASKKENAQKAVDRITAQAQRASDLLKQLKDSEDGTVTVNDKVYSADDVNQAAMKAAKMLKSEQGKLASLESSYQVMAKSVQFLVDQENTSKELMENLAQKVAEIDDQKFAVDTARQASSMSGNNDSINDELAKLAKEIEDLGVHVDAALSLETEKMNELNTANDMVDEILSGGPDLESTEKMLDDLLK